MFDGAACELLFIFVSFSLLLFSAVLFVSFFPLLSNYCAEHLRTENIVLVNFVRLVAACLLVCLFNCARPEDYLSCTQNSTYALR